MSENVYADVYVIYKDIYLVKENKEKKISSQRKKYFYFHVYSILKMVLYVYDIIDVFVNINIYRILYIYSILRSGQIKSFPQEKTSNLS